MTVCSKSHWLAQDVMPLTFQPESFALWSTHPNQLAALRDSAQCLTQHPQSSTGHRRQYKHTSAAIQHTLSVTNTTKSQWKHLGRTTQKHLQLLLLIAGVEPNPGPDNRKLTISHVKINSIAAPGKLDELTYFVEMNNIDILLLTETKLDHTMYTPKSLQSTILPSTLPEQQKQTWRGHSNIHQKHHISK